MFMKERVNALPVFSSFQVLIPCGLAIKFWADGGLVMLSSTGTDPLFKSSINIFPQQVPIPIPYPFKLKMKVWLNGVL